MQTLVEDFLTYLRHERGQSENTQRTYAALLNRFTAWAGKRGLTDWTQIQLQHLTGFLAEMRAALEADVRRAGPPERDGLATPVGRKKVAR
mgnify:CR=1 FL=1